MAFVLALLADLDQIRIIHVLYPLDVLIRQRGAGQSDVAVNGRVIYRFRPRLTPP